MPILQDKIREVSDKNSITYLQLEILLYQPEIREQNKHILGV